MFTSVLQRWNEYNGELFDDEKEKSKIQKNIGRPEILKVKGNFGTDQDEHEQNIRTR